MGFRKRECVGTSHNDTVGCAADHSVCSAVAKRDIIPHHNKSLSRNEAMHSVLYGSMTGLCAAVSVLELVLSLFAAASGVHECVYKLDKTSESHLWKNAPGVLIAF